VLPGGLALPIVGAGRATFTKTYTADATNQNVKTVIMAAPFLWDGVSPCDIIVNVNFGVKTYATATSAPGIDTGTLPAACKLTFNIAGAVDGCKGTAGAGGGPATNGTAGGPAIKINTACPIFMNVTGTLSGGGGGGGGGGNGDGAVMGEPADVAAGGNGGDGFGPTSAASGSAGSTFMDPGSFDTFTGGDGGNGGGPGTAGSPGSQGSVFSYGGGTTFSSYGGGLGGAPGKAIDLNGHSAPTWIAGNDGPHGTHTRGIVS
jgi:hypothetical protein